MRVRDIQVVSAADWCQIEGRVESEADPDDPYWFEPFVLWYRFPPWCHPYLDADNGDPFLASLLVLAMCAGERLAIPAPVSARLLEAIPDIQAIYAAFDPEHAPVPVEAVARQSPLPTAPDAASGLFFSMGVDSFYSLLKNRRDHPDDGKRVTHLLSVHGFDFCDDEWDSAFPPALLENFQRVADETNTTLVPVVTNIRRVGTQLVSWPTLHGAGMAGVALALGGGLRRVLIAASTTYDRLYSWGSHPVLDPLWSTEGLTVVHDGCEMNTIDKTAVIARSDLALATLRPCTGEEPGYNCGACLKCLRTMIDLLVAGSLDRCQTLPHEIDPRHLRMVLQPGGPIHVADYRRRLTSLQSLAGQEAVCAVLEEHLAHGMSHHFLQQLGMTKAPAPRRRLLARLLRRGR